MTRLRFDGSFDPASAGLFTRPKNTATPRVFVAATRQNDGKTTTCLGIYSALLAHFPRIGFMKPLGQRFVDVSGHRVDEDSHLINSIFDVRTPIEAMSPVTIDSEFTRRYLDDPTENHPLLVDRICRAFDRAAYEKDAVIIEGSGHAGVGAVCDLSNAQVARILRAKVILVAQAGIGRPIDEIALNKALFDQHGVEVVGAVLNKALPDKLDVVRHYASRGLAGLGIPLLGVIPREAGLAAPSLIQIAKEIGGRWLNGAEAAVGRRIEQVVVGAMTARGIIDFLQPGILVIAPGDRDDILLSAIASAGTTQAPPLSGIILTRDILPHPKIMELLAQTSIPVVISKDESYQVASRINAMTVKTLPEDHDKIPIIRQIIPAHIDLAALRRTLTPDGTAPSRDTDADSRSQS